MAQYMEREGVCPVCRYRQATYGTLRYGATAVRYTAGYMGLRASSNPGTCIARYMAHRSSDIAGILIDIWRYRPMGNMGHLLPTSVWHSAAIAHIGRPGIWRQNCTSNMRDHIAASPGSSYRKSRMPDAIWRPIGPTICTASPLASSSHCFCHRGKHYAARYSGLWCCRYGCKHVDGT